MYAFPAIVDQLPPLRYCPQTSTGFYDITYDLVPEETLANYCPQTSTGFYDITYDLVPEETLANYCEHTRESCVTETVIDKTNIAIPSFLPTDSALWLDANDSSTLTLVSGAVSEWRDKSGNLRHATQATAGNQPLLVANGLNGTDVVRFDGSGDILNTSYGLSTNHSIFIVAKNNTQTNGGSLLRPVVSTNDIVGIGAIRLDAGQELDFYITSTRVTRVSNSWLNNEVIIANSTYNGSVLIGYKNSVQQGSVSINATLTNNVNIGGDTLFSERKFKGDISQIIIFPRVLTQAEREEMEGYLAWSTGLQGNLPSGHPYKNSYLGVTVTETTVCTDFYNFAQAP